MVSDNLYKADVTCILTYLLLQLLSRVECHQFYCVPPTYIFNQSGVLCNLGGRPWLQDPDMYPYWELGPLKLIRINNTAYILPDSEVLYRRPCCSSSPTGHTSLTAFAFSRQIPSETVRVYLSILMGQYCHNSSLVDTLHNMNVSNKTITRQNLGNIFILITRKVVSCISHLFHKIMQGFKTTTSLYSTQNTQYPL